VIKKEDRKNEDDEKGEYYKAENKDIVYAIFMTAFVV
jgi:hypothetical protein